MIEQLKLYLVVFVLAVVTIVLLPFQLIALMLNLPISRRIPLYWHRLAMWLVGVRVTVTGVAPETKHLIIVANHISWVDIPVLGSIMELSFISKSEIGEMPGAGFMARMQRTVFIARDNKRDVANQAKEVTGRILKGDAMVLFGEGTTGNGNRLNQFKSSMFGAAKYALTDDDVEHVAIQPVSIAYKNLHGMPMGRFSRTKIAWYGDMTLGGHALNMMRLGAWDVEVTFGEPILFDQGSKRQEVSYEAYTRVRTMFVRSLYQRENAVETTSQ